MQFQFQFVYYCRGNVLQRWEGSNHDLHRFWRQGQTSYHNWDAIHSFLDINDPTTNGVCLTSKAGIKAGKKMDDHLGIRDTYACTYTPDRRRAKHSSNWEADLITSTGQTSCDGQIQLVKRDGARASLCTSSLFSRRMLSRNLAPAEPSRQDANYWGRHFKHKLADGSAARETNKGHETSIWNIQVHLLI